MSRKRTFKKKSRTKFVTESRVKQIIRGRLETKFKDVAITADSTPVAGTSVVTYLSGTTQAVGGDGNMRLGNSLEAQSIQIRGNVTAAAGQVLGGIYRMIVFQATTDIDGVLPVVDDLLDTDDVNSLRLFEKMSTFRVLYDKRFVLNQNDTALTMIKSHDKFLRFNRPIKITYADTGSTIADAIKNHLFLVRMTNGIAAVQPVWTLKVRMTWKDDA